MPAAPSSLLALLLFGAACSDEAVDSGELPVRTVEIAVAPSEYVANVALVTWHTDEPSLATVTATAADGETWTRSVEAAAEDHEVALIGLPEGVEVEITVVGESESARYVSEASAFSVPWAWSSLSGLTVEEGAPGYRLTTTITSGSDATFPNVLILDERGRIVWAVATPRRALSTSAKLSPDGRTVYIVAGGDLLTVGLAGDRYEEHALTGLHHDLAPMPDGAVLVIDKVATTHEGESVTCDRVLRIEDDGTSTVVWDAYPQLDTLPESSGEAVDGVRELTHGNSIRYDEATGDALLSLARMRSLVRFSVASGENRWVLGPYGGPQPAAPEDVLLQHQVMFTADGVALFANYAKDYACSEIVDYATEDAGAHFHVSRRYQPEECMESAALGGLDDAGEGRRVIAWSTAGVIDVIDADDQRVSRISAPLGIGFGYVDWTDSLYPME